MAELDTIQTANWQISAARFGVVVEGQDSLSQSIINVVATRKGTDPFRPNFGSDIWEFIDKPLTIAGPGIVRAIREAAALWIDEIEVTTVTYKYQDSSGDLDGVPSGIRFDIAWRPVFVGDASSLSLISSDPNAITPESQNIIRILATEQGPALITEAGQYIALI